MSEDAEPIWTGQEIVRWFIDELEDNNSLDADTIACIKELAEQGKLTKARLLQSLELVRGKQSAAGSAD